MKLEDLEKCKSDEEFFNKAICLIAKRKSVLDAGGSCAFHDDLRKHKHLFKNTKYVCVDIDPDRKPDIIADLHYLDRVFKEESFDAVICKEVLEHCYNPFKVVDQIYKILKPRGIVFISAPFIYSYHHTKKASSKLVNDYYRFTRAGMEQLLKKFSKVIVYSDTDYADCITSFLLGFRIEKNNLIYKILKATLSFIYSKFRRTGITYDNTNVIYQILAQK